MAAGESRSGTVRCYLRQPIASFRPEKNLSSLPDNSTDLSDAYSDSGSEYNGNSRNVVQWLQSLPADNQWCEAEEQIGRPDSSGALIDGISSIGDSDTPITLKSQAKSRAESLNVKKVSKNKKYRRGALHANSTIKEAAKSSKNSTISSEKIGAPRKFFTSDEKSGALKNSIITREKNGTSKKSIISSVKCEASKKSIIPSEKSGASKKSITFYKKKAVSRKSKNSSIATETTKITDDLENENDDTARIEVMDYRPIFNNPEFGKMLDEKMSRAINMYKRSGQTWAPPVSSKISIGTYEPPAKKSKALTSQFSASFNIKNNGMDE